MTAFFRIVLAGALMQAAAVFAQQPMLLGVQTHFGYVPSRHSAAAFADWTGRAAIMSSRDEMFWWDVAQPDGTLDIRAGAAQSLSVWRFMPQGFQALLTLGLGQQRYDQGGQPRTPQALAAFARYGGFVVRQASPPVQLVEVWNEWNLKSGARAGDGSQGGAADYVRLVAATRAEIRAHAVPVRILAGAAGDDLPDWPWTREAVKLGLLEHADGISVHLYNHCMGEHRRGADEALRRLDSLQAALVSAGWHKPIYVSEVGWPTHTGSCGVSEREAAVQVVRFLALAGLRPWLHGVWLYEWQDGGDNPTEPEHRFGLLRRDGTEKPAGCILREMGSLLAVRPSAVVRQNDVVALAYRRPGGWRWLLLLDERADGGRRRSVTVSLTQAGPGAATIREYCGATLALRALQRTQSARLKLDRQSVAIIDLPPGASLTLGR